MGTERIDFGNVGESLANCSATSESNENASLAALGFLVLIQSLVIPRKSYFCVGLFSSFSSSFSRYR